MRQDWESFGDKYTRCRLVRIACIIDFGICFMVTIPSAIGTFLPCVRGFVKDYMLAFALISGVAIFAAVVIYMIVLVMGSLRPKKRLNFYLMLLVVALMAVSFFGFACFADVGVALGVALSPQALMFCIFISSFFLEVAAYPLHLMSLILVMTPMIGAYVHLFIVEMIHLAWLIIAPIIAFALCLHIILNILWSLRTVEETNLEESDYVTEAVFILLGRAATNCCKRRATSE